MLLCISGETGGLVDLCRWQKTSHVDLRSRSHTESQTWRRGTTVYFNYLKYLSHDMTKPTEWECTQRRQISLGICPVWSESSLSTGRKLGPLGTHWAHSEGSDQTGRMPRLIWVFTGRTLILLVLSCRGSFADSVDPVKTSPAGADLIKIYTDWHSVSIFWTLKCMAKPHCSNFRITSYHMTLRLRV